MLAGAQDATSNLDKYENDVVYLKHHQKLHIFPVDGVYAEEDYAFNQESDINQNIFNTHVRGHVPALMTDSTNLCVFAGGQSEAGKDELLFGDRMKN